MDETGILRPNVDDKCRLDPDRPVNGGDRGAAADGGHFRHRHEKIIGHAANDDEQCAHDPQNPLGFRQLQSLQLTHIFRELEIASGSTVPLGKRYVLEIAGLEQSGLGF